MWHKWRSTPLPLSLSLSLSPLSLSLSLANTYGALPVWAGGAQRCRRLAFVARPVWAEGGRGWRRALGVEGAIGRVAINDPLHPACRPLSAAATTTPLTTARTKHNL